jgi:hypothetical protein
MATHTANGVYDYNMAVTGELTLHELVQEAHFFNCETNNWTYHPLTPGCFGYDNLAVSFAHTHHWMKSSSVPLDAHDVAGVDP